jgi:hypothetical protein
MPPRRLVSSVARGAGVAGSGVALVTLTGVDVSFGIAVTVGGAIETVVAVGSTVGKGLGAIVGTVIVEVGSGVGAVTVVSSEQANPSTTISKNPSFPIIRELRFIVGMIAGLMTN